MPVKHKRMLRIIIKAMMDGLAFGAIICAIFVVGTFFQQTRERQYEQDSYAMHCLYGVHSYPCVPRLAQR